MDISLDWIADYLDVSDVDAAEIAARLTAAGIEAKPLGPLVPQTGLVVGSVLDRSAHPNADRLSVCSVDVGSGDPLTIVCGAPNVAAGQKVVVATVGTTLPNGMKIGKAKIRGVASAGMICAEDEIGLGDDHQGIIVLPGDAPVGESVASYLHLAGDRFELDITANRPDAMSHLGTARDLAALLGRPLIVPDAPVEEEGPPIETVTSVSIHDPEGCPRYVARVVENVRIGPSPVWLAGRLRQVGLRPINNVVDVTNYVLMALGHPLHAFDLDRLAGNRIEVRTSSGEERFTTLDGADRRVPKGSVFICDAERPVALGGVMGGLNSEIADSTTNVLLEAAYFDPRFIRRTSKAIGLQTDASMRFERGADPEMTIRAIDWAATLIRQTAGGQVARGRIDVYPEELGRATIRLRWAQIPRILGTNVPRDEARTMLEALGVELSHEDDEGVSALQPTWRPDLTREIDLIEEIARIRGYDRIPSRLKGVGVPPEGTPSEIAILPNVRTWLRELGLQEVMTTSLVPPRFTELLPVDGEAVRLANWSNADMSVLRTHLLPSLLEVARLNFARRAPGLAAYETGHTYRRLPDGSYEQERVVGILLVGKTVGDRWADMAREWDFYDLSGVVEALVRRCSVSAPDIVHYEAGEFAHGTGARICVAEDEVGRMGQVRRELGDAFDLTTPVFYSQLDLNRLAACWRTLSRVTPLPRFPAVGRDVALVVPESVTSRDLVRTIRASGGDLLEAVAVFDVYRGAGLDRGEKSLGFRLTFRGADRTLVDEEVDARVREVVESASQACGARLRT